MANRNLSASAVDSELGWDKLPQPQVAFRLPGGRVALITHTKLTPITWSRKSGLSSLIDRFLAAMDLKRKKAR